jgi:hypothetical protein
MDPNVSPAFVDPNLASLLPILPILPILPVAF